MKSIKTGVAIALCNLALLALGIAVVEFVGTRTTGFSAARLFIVDPDHPLRSVEDGGLPDVKSLNSDNLSTLTEASQITEQDNSIVFLGDSFIFGLRLTHPQTIPEQFKAIAARRGHTVEVSNFAWPSSSPYLSNRLLRRLGKKYRPDTVILSLDMTDFRDDILYRNMLEGKKAWRFRNIVPVSLLILRGYLKEHGMKGTFDAIFGDPFVDFFITEQPLEQSRDELEVITDSIGAIHRYTTEELGAKFILVILPRHYQYNAKEAPNNWEKDSYALMGPYSREPFRFFAERRATSPYPIHSLLDAFSDTDIFPTTFNDDPHYNAAGARLAAKEIVAVCEAEQCF